MTNGANMKKATAATAAALATGVWLGGGEPPLEQPRKPKQAQVAPMLEAYDTVPELAARIGCADLARTSVADLGAVEAGTCKAGAVRIVRFDDEAARRKGTPIYSAAFGNLDSPDRGRHVVKGAWLIETDRHGAEQIARAIDGEVV